MSADITYEEIHRQQVTMGERVVYKLSRKIRPAYAPENTSQYVAVSHGREGDTAIFPCDEGGTITRFDALWSADHEYVPHEEAMDRMLTRERPGFFCMGAWEVAS